LGEVLINDNFLETSHNDRHKKTAAMVVALAAIAVFGALATVGNQAVFAQVFQPNSNTQSQSATISCSSSESGVGFQISPVTCWVDQEMGNCQVTVGAEDFSEASSDFESGDCS
jgi:hypothetical protein